MNQNIASHQQVFKFEKLIVIVERRDAKAAERLVSLDAASRLREYNVMSIKIRVIVGIKARWG